MLFSMNDFSVTAPASLEAKADTRKILSIFDKKRDRDREELYPRLNKQRKKAVT